MNRWIALLVAVAVRAGAVTLSGHAGMVIDLAQQSASLTGGRDVVVQDRTLEVKHGARLVQSPLGFAPAVPILLGEEYDVRDALGRHFRFWVRAVTPSPAGRIFVVEVMGRGETPDVARRTDAVGRYHLESYAISGLQAQAKVPDLRIEREGQYKLGSTSGSISTDDRRVFLDGYYQSWGPAEISNGGSELTFRFLRGANTFEVRFARVQEQPALAEAHGSSGGAGAP